MWQLLNRTDTMYLLKLEGFKEMGIDSSLYAAGLCDYSTILGYWDNYSISMVAFLLGQDVPHVVEVKMWMQKGLPRRQVVQAFAGLHQQLFALNVTFAFMYCTHKPLSITAKRVFAKAIALPVGTLYSWEIQ